MLPHTLNGLKAGLEALAKQENITLALAITDKHALAFEFCQVGLAVTVRTNVGPGPDGLDLMAMNLALTPHGVEHLRQSPLETSLGELIPGLWNETYQVPKILLRCVMVLTLMNHLSNESCFSILETAAAADHDWAW